MCVNKGFVGRDFTKVSNFLYNAIHFMPKENKFITI